MGINVLIIGSGGREHSLGWKISQSPKVGKLFFAPGNGGTKMLGENVPIQATSKEEIQELAEWARIHRIELTIVGPEVPLALGIVEVFEKKGVNIFGPGQFPAQIETSKIFAKQVMEEYNIPTAPYNVFGGFTAASNFIKEHGLPVVIKADGLTGGKGVYVCNDIGQAVSALEELLVKKAYGRAGTRMIIEEKLQGREVSIHAICDGKGLVLFPPSQDYKKALNGDKGLNTGGMGSIAPVPWFNYLGMKTVEDKIVRQVIEAFCDYRFPFRGCLFPGLMITQDGPKVLEFNCRPGDPETQVYMRLLETDLLDVFEAYSQRRLSSLKLEWKNGFAVCVVLTSGGYPKDYETGFPIKGLREAGVISGINIFHAGTVEENGIYKTAGGRDVCVTAIGKTLQDALDLVYEAVLYISFKGMHYRTDIGIKSLLAKV